MKAVVGAICGQGGTQKGLQVGVRRVEGDGRWAIRVENFEKGTLSACK